MMRYLLSLITLLPIVGCAQPSGGGGGGGGSASYEPVASRPPSQPLAQNQPVDTVTQDRGSIRLVGTSEQSAPVTRYTTEYAQPKTRSSAEEDDPSFVRRAAILHMTEIELGELAQRNSSSAEVQRYGAQMMNDNALSLSELRSIATRRTLKMPEELDALHRNTITRLTRLTGLNFDREYMRIMLKENEKNIDKFTNFSEGGYDPDLRGYAAKNIPTLREHWRQTKSIDTTLGALR